MRKILPFLLLVCLLLSISGLSQELKGRVLNESGERTSGVSVQFQNKSNAITTRPDGSFKIMATKLPDTLVFSAPGYEPYKVVITEKNIKDPDFEVVLLNTRVSMDEVVVRGFAATKKRDVTGSVASISREDLSGKVAGVTIAADESARSRGTASPGKEYYKASPESRSYAPISPVDGKLYLADTNIAPRTGMAAKSRILTAGEVNDFNKWKMWEEYSENEFRAMGIFWGVKPVNRYSVQLTDKKFRALVNEPVYLVSKLSGDTVWKAMTDNTGKAELWGGFLRNEKEGETYYITDRSGNKLQSPSAFANGVN
nr:carboxypeptidase-like regulatory domain-containing protein [Chitinophagaceae bacterium]